MPGETTQLNELHVLWRTIFILLSSRSLFESAYVAHVYNKNIITAIHPDGLWSFPTDLDEGLQDCQKYKTSEAVNMIELLSPEVMVQHMQCNKRHTYSALFEILAIPFIGSDSQVSTNIVDKGRKQLPVLPNLVNQPWLGF